MNQILSEEKENFWDELCGTGSFINLGLKEVNPESLKIFDSWYMENYPYLKKYLPLDELKDKSVLEIGLGFGTVGEKLFLSSKKYIGLDYAQNPVKMMKQRIDWKKKLDSASSQQGDAKSLPFENETFDYVVSIGCLHHTGNIEKCIKETHRVLKQGGETVIMLYNRNSFKRLFWAPMLYVYDNLMRIFRNKTTGIKYHSYDEFLRGVYDSNTEGDSAPVTEFVSKKDIRIYLKIFDNFKIFTENFNNITLFKITIRSRDYRIYIPRTMFLNNIARIFGFNFYIIAQK